MNRMNQSAPKFYEAYPSMFENIVKASQGCSLTFDDNWHDKIYAAVDQTMYRSKLVQGIEGTHCSTQDE